MADRYVLAKRNILMMMAGKVGYLHYIQVLKLSLCSSSSPRSLQDIEVPKAFRKSTSERLQILSL
jgi:hypothetical protein